MPATTSDRRVLENRASYDKIVGAAHAYARQGDVEGVLRAAAVAANFAWNAPMGALSDPALERLVRDAVRGAGATSVEPGRGTGRVLHVLTEGYAVGGHTRLARRWIERDPRPADVALTMQRAVVPEDLRESADRHGARIFNLREGFPDLLARAEVLRGLMNQAETVVLHVHPCDSVALAAAFLPGPRPPIVLENHADHAFWLGLGAADLVVENREIGRRVSRELRGLPEERLAVLPVPVEPPPVASARKKARALLGLRPGQVAGVAVAHPMKMAPIWGEGFADILRRVLARVPELAVVLAGPTAQGPWAHLQARFPGRVFPLGLVDNLPELYPGMDLYLDSYPCGSVTSILESAAAGLPPVSLQPHDGYAALFASSAPGLAGLEFAHGTEDEYVTALQALVEDRELRARQGRLAGEQVLAAHAGPSWAAALDEVYRRAHDVRTADLDEFPAEMQETAYVEDALLPFMLGGGSAPETMLFGKVLGPQLDERTRADLLVASQDRGERRFSVRVARGWEDHPAWAVRLFRLAGAYPWLTVSLPLVGDDDGSGAGSVAVLEPLLAVCGLTTDDCGDLNLEPRHPGFTGPTLSGHLAPTLEALEELELVLTSSLWETAPVTTAALP